MIIRTKEDALNFFRLNTEYLSPLWYDDSFAETILDIQTKEFQRGNNQTYVFDIEDLDILITITYDTEPTARYKESTIRIINFDLGYEFRSLGTGYENKYELL